MAAAGLLPPPITSCKSLHTVAMQNEAVAVEDKCRTVDRFLHVDWNTTSLYTECSFQRCKQRVCNLETAMLQRIERLVTFARRKVGWDSKRATAKETIRLMQRSKVKAATLESDLRLPTKLPNAKSQNVFFPPACLRLDYTLFVHVDSAYPGPDHCLLPPGLALSKVT